MTLQGTPPAMHPEGKSLMTTLPDATQTFEPIETLGLMSAFDKKTLSPMDTGPH
jgi:hypothetical protein